MKGYRTHEDETQEQTDGCVIAALAAAVAAHYFTLCWTYGTNLNNDRAGMKNPGEIAVDGTMSPYEIGEDYHIAVTFEQQGEATLVKW